MAQTDYTNFDYAAKSAELEAILSQLQDSETSLDEALRLHEEGKKLITELEQYLKKAELIVHRQTVDT